MSCENVGQVLELYQKYQKIWYDLTPFESIETEQYYIAIWDNPAYLDIGLYMKETMLAHDVGLSIFYNFLSNLVLPQKFSIERMEMSLPRPDNIKIYENYFGCPFIFDAPHNMVVYRKATLALEISYNNDKVLKRILEKNADELLSRFPEETTFKEFVSRSIVASIHDQRPDIEYTATKMGISTRLLQYRLKKIGTSFSEELTTIRKALATQYLENQELSIHEISALLAYKEQTSFNHAFKSWTGKSPNQWRQLSVLS
ncbi:AraC-like DNA-binding protein [Acinetobacter calcoaceticus]|uniref:AraC-like DNA-binding protein n=1 Tax=Acinetobacter calcoaceticus TaxID=471 RepID=A0A4R1XYU5_ACICA|nr:AraC-like DNA-binding protein [Acinetobacter calcoaceticus]